MTLKSLEKQLSELENPCDKCNYWKRLLCIFSCGDFDKYDKKYDEIVFKIRDLEDYKKKMWEIKLDKFYKE